MRYKYVIEIKDTHMRSDEIEGEYNSVLGIIHRTLVDFCGLPSRAGVRATVTIFSNPGWTDDGWALVTQNYISGTSQQIYEQLQQLKE